jgi:hypothetical protein
MTKIAGRVYKTQPAMTTQALSRRHKYAIGQTVTLLKVAGSPAFYPNKARTFCIA